MDLFKKNKKLLVFLIILGLVLNLSLKTFAQENNNSGNDNNNQQDKNDKEPSQQEPPTPSKENDHDLEIASQSCKKAVKLATQYGLLIDSSDYVTNLTKEIENSIRDTLKDKLNEVFGDTFKNKNIGLPKSLKDFIDKIGIKNIGDIKGINLETVVGNFIKGEFGKSIENKAKDIIKNAGNQLLELAGLGDFKKTFEGSKEILSGLTDTHIPVRDEATIAKIEEQKQTLLAEQKRQQIIRTTKEKCDQLLLETTRRIKTSLGYKLATDVIKTIQNKEASLYVKQPLKYFERQAELAANRFLSKTLPQLCEPFRIGIDISLNLPETRPIFEDEEFACTLDEAVENIKEFYKDFSKGGWRGFIELVKPQNNPYGIFYNLQIKMAEEKMKAQQEASFNYFNGYTGQTYCSKWFKFVYEPSQKKPEGTYAISYQGKIFIHQPDQQDDFIYNDPDFEKNLRKQNNYLADPPFGAINVGSKFVYKTTNIYGEFNNNDHIWYCAETQILTPASQIFDLASQSYNLENQMLINDVIDLEIYLQNIQNSIINRLINKGFSELAKLIFN